MNNELFEKYTEKRRLLAEALVEKDYLELYESVSLKNDFVIKLGEPRYELHKLELAIARTKLKLEMLETCDKYKIPVDNHHIDMELEKEFQKHYLALRSMKREIEYVHNLNENETERQDFTLEMKQLYLSIASYIHPELSENEDKSTKRTWKSVKAAYENGDVEKLKRLHKKVMSKYNDLNEPGENADLEKVLASLEERKEAVLGEIEKMKMKFPFNEAKMLEDEAAVLKFRNDMDSDIKIAKEVLDKLEKQVLEKLPPTGRYKN